MVNEAAYVPITPYIAIHVPTWIKTHNAPITLFYLDFLTRSYIPRHAVV